MHAAVVMLCGALRLVGPVLRTDDPARPGGVAAGPAAAGVPVQAQHRPTEHAGLLSSTGLLSHFLSSLLSLRSVPASLPAVLSLSTRPCKSIDLVRCSITASAETHPLCCRPTKRAWSDRGSGVAGSHGTFLRLWTRRGREEARTVMNGWL